jgi:hypothetical protein
MNTVHFFLRTGLVLLTCALCTGAPVLAEDDCTWDGNVVPNGTGGRALSPPSFPNIRVVDDFVLPAGGCGITDVWVAIIEDGTWIPGDELVVTVRAHDPERRAPASGDAGIVAEATTGFTRIIKEARYFGRQSYEYRVEGLSFQLPEGRYWLGIRNPGGSGSGTNYWLNAGQAPDGQGITQGQFSLDAGITWSVESSYDHHAFIVNPGERPGACCRPSGLCADDVPARDCGGRFVRGVRCADLDPPCVAGACCDIDGACADGVQAYECLAGRFEAFTLCRDLDPPCEPAGACCLSDGTCDDLVFHEECPGDFTPGVFCADLDPPCDPFGACCLRDGVCDDEVSPNACGGRFAEVTLCADLAPPCERAPASGDCEQTKLIPPDGRRGGAYAAMMTYGDGLLLVGSLWRRAGEWTHGAAYVYEDSGHGEWPLVAELFPPPREGDADFGAGLAVEGNTLYIGALDFGGRGAVFIFEREGNDWRLVDSLDGFNEGGSFGWSIAIEGDVLAVSELGRTVYLYSRQGGEWLLDEVVARDESSFGATVALERGQLFITSARGNGDRGVVLVFESPEPGHWVQVQQLVPEDPQFQERFGSSLAVAGGTLAIGARGRNERGTYSGAAYVFQQNPETGLWEQSQMLVGSDTTQQDEFGRGISLLGDLILVGSPLDDDAGENAGTAYLFRRPAPDGPFVELRKLEPVDVTDGATFGDSALLTPTSAIVGAWRDALHDGPSGSAYIFSLSCPDFDESGTVDLDDYRFFHDCLTGPGGEVTPSCLRADLDFDGDADLADFRILQRVFEERR